METRSPGNKYLLATFPTSIISGMAPWQRGGWRRRKKKKKQESPVPTARGDQCTALAGENGTTLGVKSSDLQLIMHTALLMLRACHLASFFFIGMLEVDMQCRVWNLGCCGPQEPLKYASEASVQFGRWTEGPRSSRSGSAGFRRGGPGRGWELKYHATVAGF